MTAVPAGALERADDKRLRGRSGVGPALSRQEPMNKGVRP